MAPNPKHARSKNRCDDDAPAAAPEKSLASYIPPYLRHYVRPHHGDFCYTPMFHPTVIAQLMMEGFLPIACADFVLPKLHCQRCVIQPLQDMHVGKQVRKKSKRYYLTVNQNFDDVVEACRRQHGDHCWLYPSLVKAFKAIHKQTATAGSGGYPTSTTQGQMVAVRLYSIEVWNVETGALAAGELGYTAGSIYTSLTGFSGEDSAGSIQLAALGKLLAQSGFTVWDLGMEMDYKSALGSRLVPRDDFVRTVHADREQLSDVKLPVIAGERRLSCRDIIDECFVFSSADAASATPAPRKKPKPSP